VLNGLDFCSLSLICSRLSHADVGLVAHQVLVDMLLSLNVARVSDDARSIEQIHFKVRLLSRFVIPLLLTVASRIIISVLPGRVHALLGLPLHALAVLSLHVIENQ
jgi:hypothetical protein